jgi:hypothetical protein
MPSVFQAEVLAIDFCARNIIKNCVNGANIFILSDSQAALKALQRPIQDSKIVEECRNSLQEFALHNNLTLMWVSHKTMGKRETLVQQTKWLINPYVNKNGTL